MEKRNFWDYISVFETSLSAAEWLWRIAVLVVIGGGSATTAMIAKTDPLFKNLGPIYWIGVGLITSLIITWIIYLIKASQLKQAEADLYKAMSTPRNTINPLSNSFSDSIIPIEDLRLPRVQLHENKHFKRCRFVGPATIAIIGGTYVYTEFFECNDIIVLPEGVTLTGVIILKNCTVENCEFIKTTILVDKTTAVGFTKIQGIRIKGSSR